MAISARYGRGRKRKHWSHHVVDAAYAAAGGVAGRMAKRMRRGPRTKRATAIRSRPRVGSRTKRRTALRHPKTDVAGTFVKCKDWKAKKFGKMSKRHQQFARKVNSVVYSQLPRATELYSYVFNLSGTDAGLTNSAVKYAQLCLDPLQRILAAPWYNGQLTALTKTGTTNPAGLERLLLQGGSVMGSFESATGPTVGSSTVDAIANGAVINIPSAGQEVMWRQSASSMKIQFKNVKSYALTLEVMLVKPKRAFGVSAQGDSTDIRGTDTGSAIGNQPTGWTLNTPRSMTPLEQFQIGLARVGGGGQLDAWTNPQISLCDSTDFNDYYNITHKCKVYLPPGGVVEKSVYHKGPRTLTATHLSNHLYDRRTTFMVIKYVPEVNLAPLSNNIPGAAVVQGVVQNGTTVDVVGTVYYRTSYKQMYGATPVARMNQHNNQVITTNVATGAPASVFAKNP